LQYPAISTTAEMTYIVSDGALISTHSLWKLMSVIFLFYKLLHCILIFLLLCWLTAWLCG